MKEALELWLLLMLVYMVIWWAVREQQKYNREVREREALRKKLEEQVEVYMCPHCARWSLVGKFCTWCGQPKSETIYKSMKLGEFVGQK